MVRLKLSTFIAAPVEDVYERVTDYGPDGPTDDDTFTKHYGEINERTGDVFLVTEDAKRYDDDPPSLISWRCTFVYAESRTMEAVASTWADRRDDFASEADGTRWDVEWKIHTGWLSGLVKLFGFKVWANKRMREKMLDPVKEYFEGGVGDDASPEDTEE
jgi:hypothetical protein